jgi:hypothetical protein
MNVEILIPFIILQSFQWFFTIMNFLEGSYDTKFRFIVSMLPFYYVYFMLGLIFASCVSLIIMVKSMMIKIKTNWSELN